MISKTYALLSIDNTQGFQNQTLNELYVPEGVNAAIGTEKAIGIVKKHGGLLYHVFDNHPLGHVSFAANYKDKQAFEMITYNEVQDRTEEHNGLSPSATFSVAKLKTYLKQKKAEKLRPVHCVRDTQGASLTPPLDKVSFDRHIQKGNTPDGRDYSGFSTGELDTQLKADNVDSVFVTGVATDYCVGQTALDAVDAGYTTYLVSDAIQGVSDTTTCAMIETLKAKGVIIITTEKLKTLLQ